MWLLLHHRVKWCNLTFILLTILQLLATYTVKHAPIYTAPTSCQLSLLPQQYFCSSFYRPWRNGRLSKHAGGYWMQLRIESWLPGPWTLESWLFGPWTLDSKYRLLATGVHFKWSSIQPKLPSRIQTLKMLMIYFWNLLSTDATRKLLLWLGWRLWLLDNMDRSWCNHKLFVDSRLPWRRRLWVHSFCSAQLSNIVQILKTLQIHRQK